MQQDLEKIKAKLNVRYSEILIGLFILGKGLLLTKDTKYFIYPPQWKQYENSKYVAIGLIALGVLLMAFAFVTPYVHKTKTKIQIIIITKILLVMAGVVCMALALIQLTHGAFTPYYRMGHSAWGDLIIFGFIYLTACDA
ncbi:MULTISPECIES: hypothetical protein [Lactobacillus]|uniref:Uncharacterized protein n=1 Tax=Lactobacillus xujianguonis TaxID=2495899 RepID=A0A437SXY1_9LACO|nr:MULTISPECIES: hypothetical protein [Lactobacillus]RVU71768.1 hypothetical protein EJK17_00380 [Lactobacillus xujianguonis]